LAEQFHSFLLLLIVQKPNCGVKVRAVGASNG